MSARSRPAWFGGVPWVMALGVRSPCYPSRAFHVNGRRDLILDRRPLCRSPCTRRPTPSRPPCENGACAGRRRCAPSAGFSVRVRRGRAPAPPSHVREDLVLHDGATGIPAVLVLPRHGAPPHPAVLIHHSHWGDYAVGLEELFQPWPDPE